MAHVIPGRFAAQADEPFVVFLIGMRINRFFAFTKWVPTALAMGPMLRTLYQYPEKGFLGARTMLSWRGVTSVQYWRSFEGLERFSRNTEDPHWNAWRRFSRVVGYKDGSVGIWHETYVVEPGHYEAVYGNMPLFGLAAATRQVPATGRRETARRRLEQDEEPAVPSASDAPPSPATELPDSSEAR
jgi:fumigallin biosynthesis monooxygenase-like protein